VGHDRGGNILNEREPSRQRVKRQGRKGENSCQRKKIVDTKFLGFSAISWAKRSHEILRRRQKKTARERIAERAARKAGGLEHGNR